jgi:DNA-binding CsgD family transcriptional regulator
LTLEEALADVEACSTLFELRGLLQRIANHYGFSSFNFLDAGQPHSDKPFYMGTVKQAWETDYARYNFIVIDPCVRRVRQSNTPFTWGSVEPPPVRGRHKPGAQRIMEAARDHGFRDGLVIPYHFRDHLGRIHSSLVAFFWEDSAAKLRFMLTEHQHELHLIMIYWVQRVVDIIAQDHRDGAAIIRFQRAEEEGGGLTDRERTVLAWAARGKTVADTADILTISEDTVESHVRNAMRKLGASNKTHAVAKAIYLSLIDL